MKKPRLKTKEAENISRSSILPWDLVDNKLAGGPTYFMTLEEVAKEMGVTRERIRQIEAKAIKKLQHPRRSKFLRPLFTDDFDLKEAVKLIRYN